ncbi:MAG: PilW family protein [Betaproteobacteria bacterium]|nr:PilW family protein [Betaproteobacteria bacterium]
MTAMRLATSRATCARQAGLSLIELMVALAISLIILVGLVYVFATSNRAYLDLNRAGQQIENGRFAVQLLTDDVSLAGFFGRFATPLAVPGALPDPCEKTDMAALRAAAALPVQGYDAPATSPLACITAANHVPGTDILVVRRADSQMAAGNSATIPGGSLVAAQVYLQANADPTGSGNPLLAAATSTPQAIFTLKNKDGANFAPIRKYHVHVYFVAPCSIPAGGGSQCTGANDDGAAPIPTLKRLELTVDSTGATLDMYVVPLVEGIENMQVDYGIDTDGDGVPNGAYVTSPAAITDWPNVMAVRISLLARNTEASPGFTDNKTYDMGIAGPVTPGGAFKRHVYNAVIRLVNPNSKRES